MTKGPNRSARQAGLVIALVDLDARDHATGRDEVNHLLPRRVVLVEGLGVKDDTRHVLTEAWRGVQHRPVGRTVLGGVRDLLRFGMPSPEPRASRLVACQEALSRSAQRVGGGLEG